MTKDIFSNQYWEKAWEDDPNTQDKKDETCRFR